MYTKDRSGCIVHMQIYIYTGMVDTALLTLASIIVDLTRERLNFLAGKSGSKSSG